jgi:deoxyribonuclease IV
VRIGIHTHTAGSLERAALQAHSLGANCFQIFSSSPRMWRSSAPDPAQVKRLRAARERYDLSPLAIHSSYLINLASLDPVIREKSIDGFHGELERAELLGADYLVIHPGSCRGRAPEEGIAAFALGLKEAAERARPRRVTVLLENTVGAGGQLGSTFEQLGSIRELAAQLTDLPVGYCLDTCHLYGAGFDLRTPAALRALVRRIDESLGMVNVLLIHANDSKATLGSRVDRHARIGEGHIGDAAFQQILRHPKLRTKPFILEIPVETDGDDRRNVEKLQALAARRPRPPAL